MNFVTRPPIDANGVGHGPDDLDEMLFAFFRSEMPDPWPELKLPPRMPSAPPVRLASAVPSPSRRPWFRSPRFALAASVALLIGGYAVMSAALDPPVPPDATKIEIDNGKADLKGIRRDMQPTPPDKTPVEDDDGNLDDRVRMKSIEPGTIHFEGRRFKGR
jgi:hypothetical protein